MKTLLFSALVLAANLQAQAAVLSEGFNGPTIPAGWVTENRSAGTGNEWATVPGVAGPSGFLPHEGARMAYVNFLSIAAGAGTISNWLISPEYVGLSNGDSFSFWTRTSTGSQYADHLEVRISMAGDSTDVGATATSVGDFKSIVLDINPLLVDGAYPEDWTMFSGQVVGLNGPASGRIAFRYTMPNGGPAGTNGNLVAVDDFRFTTSATIAAAEVPEPDSFALLGLALAGLAAIRKRKQA